MASPMMWIYELFTTDIDLDWLHSRLPVFPAWLDRFLDIAHFTLIVNGGILVVACIMVPSAFNIIDPINGPDLKTFIRNVLFVSLPIWCVIFGVWLWSVVRDRARSTRRRNIVQNEPTKLWDEWLDGPAWIRSSRGSRGAG
jgi:hypothetical protein